MPRTEARQCADVGLETCCRDLADQFCDVGIRSCRYVGGVDRSGDERERRRGGERQQAMEQGFHLVQIRIFADHFCPPVSGADVVSHATFSSSAAVETRAISRSETIFHAFLAVLRTTGRLPETVIYLFFWREPAFGRPVTYI